MAGPSLNALLGKLQAAEKKRPKAPDWNAQEPSTGGPPSVESSQAGANSGVGAGGQGLVGGPTAENTKPAQSAGSEAVASNPSATTVEAKEGAVVTAAPAPAENKEVLRARMRAQFVRQYVTELLRPRVGTRFNGTRAYMAVMKLEEKDCTVEQAANAAWELMNQSDVQAEIARQLKSIESYADLNEEYVYAQWRSIAEGDLFDIIKVSQAGRFEGFVIEPALMTKEQRLSVKKMTFSKTGIVQSIEMYGRTGALESIARARQMFTPDESGTQVADLAKQLTERLQRAAKRTGRTFDQEGRQVE